MKTLTAIRLVNWHYFVNETIRLRGSCLVTGDNGSGKTTILDAIQLVLVGDLRKMRFNTAAHDETRRSLEGYLRCKTGSEEAGSQGFLRSGDFTSHLALEFLDTRRRQPFVIGCAIDCFASGEHDKPRFYKLENQGLADALFLDGDRPYSAVMLRHRLEKSADARIYATVEQYRADLLAKFGHLTDRLFTLLVKALGFQPITDIRRFVYDYLLDPRELQIDTMRENLQQYRHFEQLVEQARAKIAALAAIQEKFAARQQVEEWIAVQDYLIRRALREEAVDQLGALDRRRAELTRTLAEGQRRQQELVAAERDAQEQVERLQLAQAQNSAFQALQQLRREIAALEKDEATLRAKALQLQQLAENGHHHIQAALRLGQEHAAELGTGGPEAAAELAAVQRLADLWTPPRRGDFTASAPAAALEQLAAALAGLEERGRQRRYALSQERQELLTEKGRLEEELAALGRRQLTYDRSVTELRRLIEEQTGAQPRILCELLEVPDERWQGAVEGYLNTQRFDLLVAPAEFDAALAVYERGKQEFKLQGVGLVNTGRITEHQQDDIRGALAAEVDTVDPWARAYVNRLLGRVMKCETEPELKRHAIAITPTCMTYRNHTARQIPFHVYAEWYIGARAFVRQRQQKQARRDEVLALLTGCEAAAARCSDYLGHVSERPHPWLTHLWQEVAGLPTLAERLVRARRQQAELDLSQVSDLQRQIDQAGAAATALRQEEADLLRQIGGWESDLKSLASQKQAAEGAWLQADHELKAFCAQQPRAAEQGAARFLEERRSRSNAAIAQGFAANRQANVTRAGHLADELFQLRHQYNTQYQFGAHPGGRDNSAYEQELTKLRDSELPTYSDRIAAAKQAAEEEFREHFVYRLREYIEGALEEFRRLNHVLRDIPFGKDRYQFVVGAASSYKPFYQMFMDPMMLEGYNLFNQAFQEKHGATVRELFDLILEGDEVQRLERIRAYTDYRTYLDYDIRILHEGGDSTLFSRVLREKSGGETQTPYYVAIVASFLQLYRPKWNEDSLRLMLFDEAFNRMDPDRAENTLRFIRQLGLQVVAAAPTDKCEIVTPYMETTLLVLREGHQAWVADYHQVLDSTALPEVAATREADAPQEGAEHAGASQ